MPGFSAIIFTVRTLIMKYLDEEAGNLSLTRPDIAGQSRLTV